MNGTRCTECGLLNLASDEACRRCDRKLNNWRPPPSSVVSPRESAKRSTWLYTLLFVTLVAGGAHYLYSGFMKSFEQVNTTDPVNARPGANIPAQRLTRSESDQKAVAPFKAAIGNSEGLSQAANHNADMQKLMQPAR